jgi:hypothetical protein
MRKHLLPIIGILIATILLYWQVALMQGIVRWDATHCFLAWRQGVSDLIQQGSFPLWSPFQHLGFPLHADPETGANYPIVWLIAALGGYDFFWFNIEWCLHIAIAGWGVYFLLQSMDIRKSIAFLAAISFMGCGVFVSNAQNYIYLIALAWSPWALRELRLLLQTEQRRYAASFALVMFMMTTGGYPGITIIFCYGLILASLYWLTKDRAHWSGMLRKKAPGLLISGLLIVLLTAPHFLSVAEFLPQLTRAEGLSEKRILENPFPLDAYASFLTPYAVGTRTDVDWHSDFSMINGYIGIIMLSVILAWIIAKGKTRREWMLFIAAIGLLIVALGEATPLRMWLCKLPALGLFRHPSIFRFHALLALIILGACVMHRWQQSGELRQWIKGIGITAGLLILLCTLHPPVALATSWGTSWQEWLERPFESVIHWHDRIWMQSIVSALLLFGTWAMVKWGKSNHGILIIAMLDLWLAVQWNAPATVVYPFKFVPNQERLQAVLDEPIHYQNEALLPFCSEMDTLNLEPIAENEFMYLRKPAWDGYNSFILRGYDDYEHDSTAHWTLEKGLLFSNDSVLIQGVSIGANAFSCQTTASEVSHLVLQQNAHSNWSCTVDETVVPIRTVKHTLMEIEIPAGTHHVQFTYASLAYQFGLILMAIGLCLSGFLLFKK